MIKSTIYGKAHDYDEKEIHIAYPHIWTQMGFIPFHGDDEERYEDVVHISAGSFAISLDFETAKLLSEALQEVVSIKRDRTNSFVIDIQPPDRRGKRLASWTCHKPDRRNFNSDKEYEHAKKGW